MNINSCPVAEPLDYPHLKQVTAQLPENITSTIKPAVMGTSITVAKTEAAQSTEKCSDTKNRNLFDDSDESEEEYKISDTRPIPQTEPPPESTTDAPKYGESALASKPAQAAHPPQKPMSNLEKLLFSQSAPGSWNTNAKDHIWAYISSEDQLTITNLINQTPSLEPLILTMVATNILS